MFGARGNSNEASFEVTGDAVVRAAPVSDVSSSKAHGPADSASPV
jgi:hypothetical protein